MTPIERHIYGGDDVKKNKRIRETKKTTTLIWLFGSLMHFSYQVTCWGSTCKECDQAQLLLDIPLQCPRLSLVKGTSAMHSPTHQPRILNLG